MRPYEPDFPGKRNPWDQILHPENFRYVQAIIEKVDSEMTRPPKYSEETRLEVYKLRDQGLTLRQIADKVGVSKSTACLYLQKYRREQEVLVTQPGTNRVREAIVSLNEINVGKIKAKPINSEIKA